MNNRQRRPPAAAEWILKRVCLTRWADTTLGDFREAYEDISARRGPAAARAWYWGQTAKSLPGFLSNRLYWSLSMLRNYLVIACRNMIKNKGFSLINLTGLAFGLAGVILIAVYVRFETSYDRFHEKAGRIARVLNSAGTGPNNAPVYFGAWFDPRLPALLAEIPEITRVTKTAESPGDRVVLSSGEAAFVQSGLFVDEEFLRVFSFPLLRGNKETAMQAAGAVLLTGRVARKLFGAENPLGRPVSLRGLSQSYNLTVAGIVADVPPNSQLQFDFLVSHETLRKDPSLSWMWDAVLFDFYTTYVELRHPSDRAVVEAKLKDLAQQRMDKEDSVHPSLQPLLDIHLRSRLRGHSDGNNEIRFVWMFSAVALALLLVAVVNTVNLSTARSASRANEIGIRKTAGAGRRQIFLQFIGESLFLSAIAVVAALALARLFWPLFKRLIGIDLDSRILWNVESLGLSAAAACLIGFLAGSYPALVLAELSPVRSLREFSRSGRKGSILRAGLVVVQFGAALVLLVGTFVIGRQMAFIRTHSPGTDRDSVIVVPLRTEGSLQAAAAVAEEFRKNPDVAAVSLSSFVPPRIPWIGRLGFRSDNDDGAEIDSACGVDSIDENFAALYGIEFLQGRNIKPGEKAIALINETMLREAGWTNPLGKVLDFGGSFKSATVVGVLKDFHFTSLHSKITPLALIPGAFPAKSISIRARPGTASRVLAGLKRDFEKQNGDQPFEYEFLDDIYGSAYKKEIRSGEIFRLFSALAIFVACLGLFGLTAFTIERKTKEIGIRKILGASTARLTAFLNARFLVLILLAHLAAVPAAFLVMNNWLRRFAYRADLTVWTFLAASAVALTIALGTISFLAYRAARMNPAETLRCE